MGSLVWATPLVMMSHALWAGGRGEAALGALALGLGPPVLAFGLRRVFGRRRKVSR